MTDDKKHDDNDRKKVSDDEMEDLAGGIQESCANGTFVRTNKDKKKGKKKSGGGHDHEPHFKDKTP